MPPAETNTRFGFPSGGPGKRWVHWSRQTPCRAEHPGMGQCAWGTRTETSPGSRAKRTFPQQRKEEGNTGAHGIITRRTPAPLAERAPKSKEARRPLPSPARFRPSIVVDGTTAPSGPAARARYAGASVGRPTIGEVRRTNRLPPSCTREQPRMSAFDPKQTFHLERDIPTLVVNVRHGGIYEIGCLTWLWGSRCVREPLSQSSRLIQKSITSLGVTSFLGCNESGAKSAP